MKNQNTHLPESDFFTIRMYYTLGDLNNWAEHRMSGYIDYCCPDKISILEIKGMAKELNLNADECSFWWFDVKSGTREVKELKRDSDVLAMALAIGSRRVVNVHAMVSKVVVSTSDGNLNAFGSGNAGDMAALREGEEEHVQIEIGVDKVSGTVIGIENKGKEIDEESDLHDSDYSFHSVNEEDQVEGDVIQMHEATAEGDTAGLRSEVDESADSDYAESGELQSCSSTDEEELGSVRPKYVEFNEEFDMKDPMFKIGMKFRSFKQFKEAVKNYGIKNRCVMNFKPNTKKRCKAYCKKGCPFYLWASPMVKDKDTVQIKSGFLKHECTRDHNIRHVSAHWIANNYLEQFRADPSWKVAGIMQAVKSNQQADISRLKAWRAKCIALRIIDGDEQSQIARLYDYSEELMTTHPGSTVKFKCNAEVFAAMYVCLGPLKAGFLDGCRNIISLDGCFLKGLYGGQLLSAVGIDANDSIYPLAWAIVAKENRENWQWFLELLAEDLGITNSYHWAFMSDRQKGLIPAIEDLFPNSEHRFCVRHIHTNFRQTFKGKALKDQLWACARSSYIPAYEKEMECLNGMCAGAYQYLKNIDPKHWTRSHFQTQFKCDMLLNNLCECFNSQILEARTKGIITMNEMIRTKLMVRIQRKRDAMHKCKTLYCPKILAKLEKSNAMSNRYTTTWSGGDKYQVLGHDGQFIVDTKEWSCTCRKWQLTGIPCSHAISALYYNNYRPENYIDECYKVTTFLRTYSHILNPTHDRNSWPKSNQTPMIPPEPINKKRGRKALLRRKEADEVVVGFTNGKVCKKGVKMRCSICRNPGHNKRLHGVQGEKRRAGMQPSGQSSRTSNANVGESNDPTSTIDPQVLEEIYAQVDLLNRNLQSEVPTAPEHVLTEQLAQPQVIDTSVQENVRAPYVSKTRREKLNIKRSKRESAKKLNIRPAGLSRIPVLRPRVKDKVVEDRNKEGVATKKRKLWIPPGVGGSTGSSGTL